MFKAITKFCRLPRQVVSHDRENNHDFVKNVPDKSWNLRVLVRLSQSYYTGSTVACFNVFASCVCVLYNSIVIGIGLILLFIVLLLHYQCVIKDNKLVWIWICEFYVLMGIMAWMLGRCLSNTHSLSGNNEVKIRVKQWFWLRSSLALSPRPDGGWQKTPAKPLPHRYIPRNMHYVSVLFHLTWSVHGRLYAYPPWLLEPTNYMITLMSMTQTSRTDCWVDNHIGILIRIRLTCLHQLDCYDKVIYTMSCIRAGIAGS